MIRRLAFGVLSVAVVTALGACKPRKESAGSEVKGTVLFDVNNQYPLPVMYHFGTYKYLSQNGTADAFTPDVWQKITGEYVPHRKGLYVAIHPSFNERYADSVQKDPKAEPWVMAVELDPKCLDDSVVLKRIFQIDQDPDFRKWNAEKVDYLAKNCPYKSTADYVNTFALKQNACEEVLEQYIKDRKFRVVHDEYWYDSGFWIVRDPSCIKDMRASPEEVLHILAQPEVWSMDPFTSAKKRDGEAPTLPSFYIMLRALLLADSWEPSVLQDLLSALGDGDATKFKTLDPEYDPPIPHTAYAIGRRIVDTAKDCQVVSNTQAFKAALRKALDDVKGGADPEARLIHFATVETEALPCKPTHQQWSSYDERNGLKSGVGRLQGSYWSVVKAKGDVQACIKEIRPNSQCYLDREDPQQFACNAHGFYSHDLPGRHCVASLPMEFGLINYLPATIELTEISDADRPAWYEIVAKDPAARGECAKVVTNFFAGTRCYESQLHEDRFYCGFLDNPFNKHWDKADCIKIKAGPKKQKFIEEKDEGY